MAEKEQRLTVTKISDDQFAVWFDEFDVENKQRFTVIKLARKEMKLYEEDTEPLLQVSRERMQKLMDDLWEFGLRPKGYDGKQTE